MELIKVLPIILVIFISGCTAQVSETNRSENQSYSQPSQETSQQPTEQGTLQGEVVQQEQLPSLPMVREFTIKESNFKLIPPTITANKGDVVKINVMNDQGTHNLFIEGYNKRSNVVSAGNIQVIEFVADKIGIFKMWCEVGGHRSLGMEGQLVIS